MGLGWFFEAAAFLTYLIENQTAGREVKAAILPSSKAHLYRMNM